MKARVRRIVVVIAVATLCVVSIQAKEKKKKSDLPKVNSGTSVKPTSSKKGTQSTAKTPSSDAGKNLGSQIDPNKKN